LQRGKGTWILPIASSRLKTGRSGVIRKIVYDAATKLLASSTTNAPPEHQASGAAVITVDALKDETNLTRAFPGPSGNPLRIHKIRLL
jgi:hypothetical protein